MAMIGLALASLAAAGAAANAAENAAGSATGKVSEALAARHRGAYTTEWQATSPDFVVFIPDAAKGPRAKNEHFIILPLPSGTFFAVWTTGYAESHENQHVVFSTSRDRGETWTPPEEVAGPAKVVPTGEGMASWGFPIHVPRFHRVYVFYLRNIGPNDWHKGLSGEMRFRFTEDEGRTWSDEATIPFRRTGIMSPDPAVPPNWIIWQAPVEIEPGEVIGCGTVWASKRRKAADPKMPGGTEAWFWRFDGIVSAKDPRRIRATLLPDGDHGIRMLERPGSIDSAAEEPTVVRLSDGRWFCVFRTHRGCVGFSISRDRGRTWDPAKPLRYRDGGAIVLHPRSSCPLYPMDGGRFLLTTHANDGSANGGRHPYDGFRNRTPTFYLIGKEVPDAEQPIWFSTPIKFLDNGAKPAGPEGRTSVGIYTSFFILDGKRYFWYPDRKHFLLGRLITDAMIRDAEAVWPGPAGPGEEKSDGSEHPRG
ncbi:MAG: exo-alpha-sialidase [Planctomycetes bacterium]|nr:exo-alpha-sialidase [Planctomycetota bacterium]